MQHLAGETPCHGSGLLVGVVATICDAGSACVLESVSSPFAELLCPSFVFVVGGDVVDPQRKPEGVVLVSDRVEGGGEVGGVTDGLKLGPFGLDVAEEATSPGTAWCTLAPTQ